MNQDSFQNAFAEYDKQVRIANSKLGAVLATILMPAGVVLDYFVYREHFSYFLKLRLLCSLLVIIVWALFFTNFGKRHYRILGMTWYMLPAACIAWMIYAAQDPLSPYYAGLNIVLLGVGLILPWTYQENLLAGGLVILMYLGASFLQGTAFETKYLVNNLYFLVLTAFIVVVASFFHSKLRFREFSLRYELDENRKKLEEGNRKLMELDRVKSRFFANMSHELRTPLTLLIAPLETILHTKGQQVDAEVRRHLQTMHANGMRLLKLINDLLDLEKLESGKMQVQREPLAIAEFVRGLTNSVQGVANDKRLKLSTSVSDNAGTILVDRDKFEKVVLNLLFNALKFTPAGGEVTISADRQDGVLQVQVTDTGVGIAAEQLPFIFDRFWQADTSAHRKYQGTGIGLALVKELTEAQGGQVEVKSRVGQGTTMTVRIPCGEAVELPSPSVRPGDAGASLAPTNEGPSTERKTEEWLANLYRRAEFYPSLTSLQQTVRREETSATDNKPRVLIADDEPDMLGFLKSQLTAHFNVLEAIDGQQAVEKATQFLPEIILLDMMMPEKDGLEVCRELRAKTATRNIPVILLTARADEDTKLTALGAGANDFLSKPFSTSELHLRVKNLVDQHELQRRLARQNRVLESTLEQLKDAQAQLVQAEKLAGLGRMSAGIIHEINNPLNYAKTGLFALKKKGSLLPPTEKEDFDEVLRDIEEGVDRVKNIVSDLRSFTHPNTDQVEQVNVKGAVESSLRLLSDQLRGIKIDQRIADDFVIDANSNKLVQVLVNLLQNAIDAVNRKTFQADSPVIAIEARIEGERRLLSIRDNGQGIARQHLGKIFDPFFTTKDVGEGMGLGLSICYRIVAEYGGRISVESEENQFTQFTLDFPKHFNIMDAA